ncbi:hypothetical protein VTL71DRAFT_15870 [Oculimacula yallundae]|uniref:Ubiquitin-like domain-containing protein n=1 Tax=Oculimacula yallundae TaxID=86028 RepID=A0ABR4CF51_9HELO
MAPGSRLRVELGKPLHKVNGHESIFVHQNDDLRALEITFNRTIKVPEDGTTYDLPPGLGNFPLYNVVHYGENLPENISLKGGCFMPVYDREALWISFKSTKPFAIKVLIGGINAVSGEPIMETFATRLRRSKLAQEKSSIQDYIVVDPADQGQLWLDGIAKLNGKVMQFVAVPSGTGYSVEAQIAETESVGGIQIVITPIRAGPILYITVYQLGGKPTLSVMIDGNATVYALMCSISQKNGTPISQMGILFNNRRLEQNRLLSHYGICNGSFVNVVLNLCGGGVLQLIESNPVNAEMGVGAGGLIRQSILSDPHASIAWDSDSTAIFNIQLLNATIFESVTGRAPPPSPITAESYAEAGLPFFALPKEADSGIKGLFSDVKGIHEVDVEKGAAQPKPKFKYKGPSRGQGWKKELKFPTLQLDKSGHLEGFRSVENITQELNGWGITQFS